MHITFIFMWKALHKDSFWNRDTRYLGMAYYNNSFINNAKESEANACQDKPYCIICINPKGSPRVLVIISYIFYQEKFFKFIF